MVNIHINRTTRLQPWDGRTVFGEYPVFIRPGNFTVTLLFHDAEAVRKLYDILGQTLIEIAEIEGEMGDDTLSPIRR